MTNFREILNLLFNCQEIIRKVSKGHDELDYEHSIIGPVSAMELSCGHALINRSRPKMIHAEGHAEGLLVQW